MKIQGLNSVIVANYSIASLVIGKQETKKRFSYRSTYREPLDKIEAMAIAEGFNAVRSSNMLFDIVTVSEVK